MVKICYTKAKIVLVRPIRAVNFVARICTFYRFRTYSRGFSIGECELPAHLKESYIPRCTWFQALGLDFQTLGSLSEISGIDFPYQSDR